MAEKKILSFEPASGLHERRQPIDHPQQRSALTVDVCSGSMLSKKDFGDFSEQH
jgi:hypothetical protein